MKIPNTKYYRSISHWSLVISYWSFKRSASGQILIIGIIFMAVILILSASLFSRVANYVRFGSNDILREQANSLAEAGIERTLWKLNTTAGACDDCTGEKTLGTTGSFEVTIQTKSSTLKTITSTGYVPSKANPRAKRVIKTDAAISNEIVSFNYGVQVGAGGFSIVGGSTINGNVYSNADITGGGGSIINGDAYAVGTITTTDSKLHVSGTRHPGASPAPMPIQEPHDTWYQQWRDAAVAGGTESSACTLGYTGGNIGPKKYACNVTINGGGQWTVKGPIWIVGNLNLTAGADLWLDSSFGSNETAIIVDGTISVAGGADIHPTSSNPKGYLLLVTTSTSSSALSLSGGTQSSIFYALDGTSSISGGTHLTAIVAKQLNISGGTILTYDSGLASSSFSGGPGGSWNLKKGTYRYSN